jgi:endogenous inhibitor of DNA gyrase (YacG/DUF329 family)
MASVIHVDCSECGGKSIVKIPNDYQDDYQVVACPLCGAAAETHDDLDDE